MPNQRILVVDDHEGFRRFICSTLEQRVGFQVIGEASDGLEALEKAKELQPDLVLLDIGLPKLNGLETAKRFYTVAPHAKILFLSVESDPDLVQEALRIGTGYVHKARAQSDLLSALNAVLRGEQFISPGLEISGGTDEDISSSASLHPQTDESTRYHEAAFYLDDSSFLDHFTRFIGVALGADDAVIVITTEPHRENLARRLRARGVDMAAAIEKGRCISLDAHNTLSTFMVNELPDRDRFLQAASDLVARAAKTVQGDHRRVAACGECAPLLWQQGNGEAAIRLERLWDEFAKTQGVRILCGYSPGTFRGGSGSHVFDNICAEHSAVYVR